MMNNFTRKIIADPIAKNNCVVVGNARFSILSDRIIRLEYSSTGNFEDRATQHVWFRNFDIPFEKRVDGESLTIETSYLKLTYDASLSTFDDNLKIELKENGTVWSYGDIDNDNLKGTYRTLDECNGEICERDDSKIKISDGLVSKSGWATFDDSDMLVFNDDGYLIKREQKPEIDLYFLGYGRDYKAAITDYYKIAGKVPLLPKWALGVWWSRWEKYSQDDLLNIVDEFKQNDVPLSALVIDMDWHIVENEYTGGWTGYTWNDELFPNPEGLFENLHNQNIHACLNLHPADGVHPHEAAYEEFAKYMGIDPSTKQPVEFDISDPKFIEGYFKYLHHPLEKQGVDFWWIDWQQGTKSKVSGLDPLWYLNHLHSNDIKRDGEKRPFTFSRWSNNGCHRYPIGFSGDTVRSWDTLKYLPYFTATAANVGYGWWSHDVGGFCRGFQKDDELYARWMQFATFSPIFRIHNCGDTTIDYRPWSKDGVYKDVAIEALKLRNKLVEYIYTHSWKNSNGEGALLKPMYYDYPDDEKAYIFENQYMFGDDILVSPVTEQIDDELGLVRKVVWLPKGDWYELSTGRLIRGGGMRVEYCSIFDIPVYVKAGATIPFAIDGEIELRCYPGEGESRLYIDDGVSMDYANGKYAELLLIQKNGEFHIEQIGGDLKVDKQFKVTDGIKTYTIKVGESVKVALVDDKDIVLATRPDKKRFIEIVSNFKASPHAMKAFLMKYDEMAEDVSNVANFAVDLTNKQMQCIIELYAECGFYYAKLKNGSTGFVYWNKNNNPKFSAQLSLKHEYWYANHVFADADEKVLMFNDYKNWLNWSVLIQYQGFNSWRERKYD